MHHHLHTEIDITADPTIVWDVLTDLDRWAEWNPFITSSSGNVAVGETLENRLEPPGGRAMTFRPTLTVVDEAHTLEWLGRLGLPGLFDGRHRFELRSTASGGTRLTHDEHFSGLLVRPLRRSLDTGTLEGFHRMNAALKQRAEARAD